MNRYEHIIDLPHPEPKKHQRMSKAARAGQFAPFAALTGYEECVAETARLTDTKIEIDDGLKEIISDKLNYISNNIDLNPEVTICYFLVDEKKSGGSYETITDYIKKIDLIKKVVIMKKGKKIFISDIINITKYSLQGTTQGRYLTGGVPPVRFSM